MAKLAQLRRDADAAEERAAAVTEEAKELAQALEERRAQLDQRAQDLVMSRNKVDKLAQVTLHLPCFPQHVVVPLLACLPEPHFSKTKLVICSRQTAFKLARGGCACHQSPSF